MAEAALKARLLSLIDLTSLSSDDTSSSVIALCQKALAAPTAVAAICVYPRFAKTVVQLLQHHAIKCAVVANFPSGEEPLENVIAQIQQARLDGVDEIDVVFPYTSFLAGDILGVENIMRACQAACGNEVTFKVILETGALPLERVAEATRLAIATGADFVKTSTGKINIGATLAAAEIMLLTIKEINPHIGLKVSGGIRTFDQAQDYFKLAVNIMGDEWVNSAHFRLGASQLFAALIE